MLGLVVAGDQYGQSFKVCIARDRCLTHWKESVKAKEKATKLRESGKGQKAAKVEKKAEESWEAKQRRERAERDEREKAWTSIAPHVLAEAIAQVKPIKTLTPKLAAALLDELGNGINAATMKKHCGATWFKTPVSSLLVASIAAYHYASWGNNKTGFDDFVDEMAKPFGLDLKRLEAIRDKHQPKPEPKPADAKGRSAAKAKKAKAA